MTQPWHMARAASRRPLPRPIKMHAAVYPAGVRLNLDWYASKRAMLEDRRSVVNGPFRWFAANGVIYMHWKKLGPDKDPIPSGRFNCEVPYPEALSTTYMLEATP